MTRPPLSALLIGLAGLIPFVWGLMAVPGTALGVWTAQNVSPRLIGPYVQLAWGTVALSFMSGVLFGFAARATGPVAASAYGLACLPALWAFFMIGGGPVSAAWNLIFGFLALLLLDAAFQRLTLAPPWWLSLRVPVTVITLLCLFLGAMA